MVDRHMAECTPYIMYALRYVVRVLMYKTYHGWYMIGYGWIGFVNLYTTYIIQEDVSALSQDVRLCM
jgi:hypothetical protein